MRVSLAAMRTVLFAVSISLLSAGCHDEAVPSPARKPASVATVSAAAPTPVAGHPYFGGIWLNPYGGHKLGKPDNPKYVRPPIPVPKLTPEYQAQTRAIQQVWEHSQAKGIEGISADSVIVKRQILCLPYGMPTEMAYNMSFDIHQTADRITIVGELDRAIRRIWLDRPQQNVDEVDPGFWGRSVGHWDGDTLEVDTVGIKTGVYGENFMAHSEQMAIKERISLAEPDILYDRITVTDPLALTEPFTFLVILNRAPKDYEPSEFVCDQYPAHVIGPDGKITINTKKGAVK
jgi:hypothetical protein